MKMFASFGLLALAACAAPATDDTSSQAQPPGQVEVDPIKACDTSGVQDAVGKPFTDALAAELKTKVGAATLRIIPPGTMVTMDYRGDRLNISYDEEKIITKVDCG